MPLLPCKQQWHQCISFRMVFGFLINRKCHMACPKTSRHTGSHEVSIHSWLTNLCPLLHVHLCLLGTTASSMGQNWRQDVENEQKQPALTGSYGVENTSNTSCTFQAMCAESTLRFCRVPITTLRLSDSCNCPSSTMPWLETSFGWCLMLVRLHSFYVTASRRSLWTVWATSRSK